MNLSDLELFVRTTETGSLTATAQQLNITPAAASAALKRLEQQLGATLFLRSTRRLRMTAQGERFLIHCRQALAALDEGRASIRAAQGRIEGVVRLSVSSGLGRNLVLPWLDEVMDEHPDLAFDLLVGDSLADFYLDRVDVALRYGDPEDSSMVAFQIAAVDRVLCAAPAYLSARGMPAHPNDLLQHNCLLFQLGSKLYDMWRFSNEQGSCEVRVRGNRTCNDADIVHRWALAGKGIAYKSRLEMMADLAAGRLVEILPQFRSAPVPVWLICPSRKQVTPAVLLLREMLRVKCAELLAARQT